MVSLTVNGLDAYLFKCNAFNFLFGLPFDLK